MLSVLIVNWNTRDLLQKCLQSLQDHPAATPMEIIVVDNDSNDGSADMVRARFPGVVLVSPGRNTGYAAGNNLAFREANGEWLLTLNPDTEVQPGCLDHCIGFLAVHLQHGCASVRLIGIDGLLQQSVRGFPTGLGILGDLTGLARRFPDTAWDSYRRTGFDYELEQDAPQPMGTFLMFRRQALAAIGDPRAPFDEAFPIFFNEVDLLYRLHRAGWPCRYLPGASVLHHGGESTKQVRKSMIWESHRSLVKYFKKHRAKGVGMMGLPFLALAVYSSAFVRAKGYHAGFRP